MAKTSTGTVYLVGAGPGDAGLLTLRGAELLRAADVVIYDALVNSNLLHLAPESAELVFGGKRAARHAIPQPEINQLLIEHAKAGRNVVRLKGGDPYIFGRGGEEISELAKAKIPFEVVPGVSAFHSVAAYAGIPITHRDHSSGFVVITGYEDPDKPEPVVDWSAVANAPGTKIVFMGVKQIGPIADALKQHGMKPKTPVALVRWGTTGRQQTIEGTLDTIEAVVTRTNFKPPAMIIIGDVVKLRPQLNWFEKRPLLGRRVVLTRPLNRMAELSAGFARLGADVLELPVIRTEFSDERMMLTDALMELNSYSWLVFTSVAGVDSFFAQFFKAFPDLRDLGGTRLAAVGPATAARLEELHLKVDVMPKVHTAKAVAKAINEFESVENLKVCLLRADQANPDLPAALEELRAIVDDIPVYRTVAETVDRTGAGDELTKNGADWVTFTSGSCVRHFHERFDLEELQKRFPQLKIASIGPETTAVLNELGFKPDVEAKEHTGDGLFQAVLKAKRPDNPKKGAT